MNTPRDRSRSPARALLLGLAPVALLAACETVSSETSDGRPMPPPARTAQRPPDAAPINAMSVLYAPKPQDTDANGRPDRLGIELYLFARPYPAPVWRDGTFTITAYPIGKAGNPLAPGANPVHAWSLSTRQGALDRFRSLIGEGFRAQVSLLDGGGTDRIPGTALDFVASFQPDDGGPRIWCDGVRSLSFAPVESGEVR